MKLIVKKDHDPHRKGEVVELDQTAAMAAIREKWAVPAPVRYAVARETR